MKYRIINRNLIFFLLLASVITQSVQSQMPGMPSGAAPGLLTPGYVILASGDTVRGELKWALRYVENNPVEIKFTSENGASKDLNASEIRGFGQISAFAPVMEHYVSLPSPKKGIPVFLCRLTGGKITIYQNRSSGIITTSKAVGKIERNLRIDGIHFSWIPGEGLYVNLSFAKDYRIIEYYTRYTSYFVSKEGGHLVKVSKDGYSTFFNEYFGDCPLINDEIRKNPGLSEFKNFMIIAEVYNRICR